MLSVKKMTLAEDIATEFFKRRFPEKDIEFEKKCGYFYEWVKRFASDDPKVFMDEISLDVWNSMKMDFPREELGV